MGEGCRDSGIGRDGRRREWGHVGPEYGCTQDRHGTCEVADHGLGWDVAYEHGAFDGCWTFDTQLGGTTER